MTFHWYFRVTGAGLQVPGLARSVEPTFAAPVIDGVCGTRVPAAMVAVDAEVFATVVYPALLPVTTIVIFLPA